MRREPQDSSIPVPCTKGRSKFVVFHPNFELLSHCTRQVTVKNEIRMPGGKREVRSLGLAGHPVHTETLDTDT